MYSYDTEAAQVHLPAQAGGKPSSCTPFTLCAPDNSLFSYEMRLKECGLTTLETRRLRDQTEVFEILNGYENIDRNIFFTVKE